MQAIKKWLQIKYAVSEYRLGFCRKCEHFEEGPNRCDKCGCFMDFKTLIQSSECPIGKWGKWVDTDQK